MSHLKSRHREETLRKYIPPSKPTLRRTIQSVNADEVDLTVGKWLAFQSTDDIIAVDGKVLRGSKAAGVKPVHLVSALLHHDRIVIGQQQVDRKSNEIKAFKPLLEPLELKGKIVTADAMQTQVENARFIVEDKGADYIFPVKQKANMIPASSPDEALGIAYKLKGEDAGVVVIPDGVAVMV